MAEGGFDDYDMEDRGEEYTKYNEMDNDQLRKARDELSDRLLALKGDVSPSPIKVAEIDSVGKKLELIRHAWIEGGRRKYSFVDEEGGRVVIKNFTIEQSSETTSVPGITTIDIPDNPGGEAVSQFRKNIEDMRDREDVTIAMPMMDMKWDYKDILGLTLEENAKLSSTMSLDSRTGNESILQASADSIQDTIDKTSTQLEDVSDDRTRAEISARLLGLEEAMDRLLKRKEADETRVQQEEDIDRLQRFKRWAKENLLGLSAVAISIAAIITTTIIGARKAVMGGAQATSKFAKAVANLAKKVWPVLGPILGLISQAISLGAKGLAWLSKNLWVLALAFAWFAYDASKQVVRRKR